MSNDFGLKTALIPEEKSFPVLKKTDLSDIVYQTRTNESGITETENRHALS